MKSLSWTERQTPLRVTIWDFTTKNGRMSSTNRGFLIKNLGLSHFFWATGFRQHLLCKAALKCPRQMLQQQPCHTWTSMFLLSMCGSHSVCFTFSFCVTNIFLWLVKRTKPEGAKGNITNPIYFRVKEIKCNIAPKLNLFNYLYLFLIYLK